VNAKPVGAFVIRGDDVTWRPAIDVNWTILGAQVVALVALLRREVDRQGARASIALGDPANVLNKPERGFLRRGLGPDEGRVRTRRHRPGKRSVVAGG
jgi:hypothetical protein